VKFYDSLKKFQQPTFNILINTGARINEARHIGKQHIDFRNQRLTLQFTKVRAKQKEKTPTPRTIPISSQFSRYLKRQANEILTQEGYIKILSTPAANIAMKKALHIAKIDDYYMFSVHNIRKTLETWLLALGVDPFKIMLHFGHKTSTAIQHYISPDAFSFREKQIMRNIIGDLYNTKI
jgi:integrase